MVAEGKTSSAFYRHRTLLLNTDWQPIGFPPRELSPDDTVTDLLAERIYPVAFPSRSRKAVARSSGGLEVELPVVAALTEYGQSDLFESLAFNRETLFYRDGNMCMLEGRLMNRSALTVEHVTPQWILKQQGRPKEEIDSYHNCVAASQAANNRKGGRTVDESGMAPLIAPWQPTGRDLLAIWWDIHSGHCPPEWADFLDLKPTRAAQPIMDMRREAKARQGWEEARAA